MTVVAGLINHIPMWSLSPSPEGARRLNTLNKELVCLTISPPKVPFSALREMSARLPDYSLCGKYDGSVPASRWLARLAYDMRRAGTAATPEEFFEATEIL